MTAFDTTDEDTVHALDSVTFWRDFEHGSVHIDGVKLHFVAGGSGRPILLLPGWPQSWYAWRYVMPLLSEAGFRVVALDPRGMGDSDHPPSGYDTANVAREVHKFIVATSLAVNGPIDIVGHDVGTWIGHALAADWPDDVRRLALFDAALPGITPPPPAGTPSEEANIKSWHFAFNRLVELPEILIQGREREFLGWMFRAKAERAWTITPADLDEYVRVNALPGATRAVLGYYRDNLSDAGLAASKARAQRKLAMPVLAIGAEHGVGTRLLDTMRLVAENVRGGVFNRCGHYIPEEAPRTVVEQLLTFMRL